LLLEMLINASILQIEHRTKFIIQNIYIFRLYMQKLSLSLHNLLKLQKILTEFTIFVKGLYSIGKG